MAKYIMVGADLHDNTVRIRVAADKGQSKAKTVANTWEARQKMYGHLRELVKKHGAAGVLFAYEAGRHGFWLYDEVEEAGFHGAVLAPTEMERSASSRVQKNDDRDALRCLDLVRAAVLAGKEDLPLVAVPDPQTRADREPVRRRVRLGNEVSKIKCRINALLCRNNRRCAGEYEPAHLAALKRTGKTMPAGARWVLESLLRELNFVVKEQQRLDKVVTALAGSARYREYVEALKREQGVGTLTALTLVVEFGDPRRFENRQHVGAFLGLTPKMADSGERVGRHGHITRKGPGHVRKMLCQATWARLRENGASRAEKDRWMKKHPRRAKVFTVALMRRLAIVCWHRYKDKYRAEEQDRSAGGSPYWRTDLGGILKKESRSETVRKRASRAAATG